MITNLPRTTRFGVEFHAADPALHETLGFYKGAIARYGATQEQTDAIEDLITLVQRHRAEHREEPPAVTAASTAGPVETGTTPPPVEPPATPPTPEPPAPAPESEPPVATPAGAPTE